MTLALCAGFLTATVLFYAWSYGAFRNTDQNLVEDAWGEAKASAASIVVTALMTATCAFAISASLDVASTIASLNAVTFGVIAVCAALLWFLPRRLLKHAAGADRSGPSPDGTVLPLRTGTGEPHNGTARPAKKRKAA